MAIAIVDDSHNESKKIKCDGIYPIRKDDVWVVSCCSVLHLLPTCARICATMGGILYLKRIRPPSTFCGSTELQYYDFTTNFQHRTTLPKSQFI
jgi:hypothetical protein